MNTPKPTKKILTNLAKSFKNQNFNLLERTRDALEAILLYTAPGKASDIIPDERPDLLKDYYDTDLDLAKPQLITLANDCVYIVRTVQACGLQVDNSRMMWRAVTTYIVYSVVCLPGNREQPDDFDDVQHYEGSSEIEALMAAIKVVLWIDTMRGVRFRVS